MIVNLSNGHKVHLAEKWTHKAQRVFTLAMVKGAVEHDDPKTGERVLRFPPENSYLCYDAVLPVVVTKIETADGEIGFSEKWLEDLEESDFDKLKKAIDKMGKKDPEGEKKD